MYTFSLRTAGQRFRLWGAGVAAAAALLTGPAPAQAQYPDHAIKLIVPFAPGGTSDVVARLVSKVASEHLRQTIVVENRGGAGSIIGTDAGAKAAPDGYTLVLTNGAAITTGPMIGQKISYDPIKDFTHMLWLGTFPNGLIVRHDHPARSFEEFVKLARAAGDKYSYGSAGVGSAGFLAGELLKLKAGLKMVHIPYKGTGAAINDLVGGQLDAIFNNPGVAAAQVRAGNARILAVSGARRIPTLPDVPTMDEVVPGAVGEAWFGISGPAGLPPSVIAPLVAAFEQAMKSEDLQAKLIEQGFTPDFGGPEVFARNLQSEIAKWGPVIKAADIKLE
ncbi:MAG: tripartite tricarboxylate transporter substrate binding protein [Pigmentiphaga sp.]|uniref:Bug family tripartite tricarboxylate transporter substrate binding protein n=1 Tax=Pigmentiphaga sp. TaxID=1977564 RepID=UPI0029A67CA2|nr:tripartite tricarboxylate transporter substrate binding protein [Pigmentiphaga sp.]MDX3907404.1 tripartite tricarboxylate transporter substrate binding protein [Pigmentiphaga sp.]